jgi:hypothetical protein
MVKTFALKVIILLAKVVQHLALVIVTFVLMLAALVVSELIGKRILHID